MKISPAARQEWREHGFLALASALGASMAMIAVASLGVFMRPLQETFGWSRVDVSLGLTVYAIIGAIGAPIVGRMIDKWGAPRIGIVGVVADGAMFALFSTVTGSMVHWLGVWVLFAVATQGTRPLVWTAAVSSKFDAGRGLAISAVLVGTSLGGMVSPILAHNLIEGLGWRSAYVVMGLGWGGGVGTVCYYFFRSELKKLNLAQQASQIVANRAAAPPIRGMLLSPTFLKLAAAELIATLVMVGMSVNLVPLLIFKGLSGGNAALLVGLGGVGAIIGSLAAGSLVARIAPNVIACAIPLTLGSAFTLLMPATDNVAARIVPVVLISIASGAQTHMFAYLTSRYFDLRCYGRIYGVLSSLTAVGVGAGPLIVGAVFDRFQDYDVLLLGALPLCISVSLLLLWLGRQPAPLRAAPA